MINKKLHVAFSESAGGTIKYALGELENSDFTAFPDDLGTGPVKDCSIEKRTEYLCSLYTEDDRAEYASAIKSCYEKFRKYSSASYEKKILWLSRRSVSEYCGFLQFLSEQNDLSQIEVVDITDGIEGYQSDQYGGRPYRAVPIATGEMSPEMVLKAVNMSRQLTADETDYYLPLRERLREENSDLRTIIKGQLYSAEEYIYDDLIEGLVTDKWRSAARVVGESLGRLCNEYHLSGDSFICTRLLHLIDSGKVQARGDIKSMRFLEVKRDI